MPNRILKESICTSNNLNNLTPEEEIFFYRLIVNCDDYGRMDARPAILRARLFPLRTDSIKEDHIIQWLQSLQKQDLLDIYEVNGHRYLKFKTWENHQQIRAKRSKYPDPNGNLITIDNPGNQMKSSVIKCPRNPIQSESNPNPKENIPSKKSYGEFNNVLLTNEEYQKLKDRFKDGLVDKIEALSSGIESKGYKYQSHYATILSWERRDQKTPSAPPPKSRGRWLPTAEEIKQSLK